MTQDKEATVSIIMAILVAVDEVKGMLWDENETAIAALNIYNACARACYREQLHIEDGPRNRPDISDPEKGK